MSQIEQFVKGKRVDSDEPIKAAVAAAMKTHEPPTLLQRLAAIEQHLKITHGAPDGTRYIHDEDGDLVPEPKPEEES